MNAESRKLDRRSRSPDAPSHRKNSSKRKQRDRSSSKRKKLKNGSHHKDKRRSSKKRKKSKSEKHKKKKNIARSDDSEGNSEPEEGEITESEKEDWESTPSSSSSSSSPSQESPEIESEMEIQSHEGERKNELHQKCPQNQYWTSLFNLCNLELQIFILSCVCCSSAFRGCHIPVMNKFGCFSCSQRHLASLCKSDCSQVSGAAGWHVVHHHGRLSGHLRQVCALFSAFMLQH